MFLFPVIYISAFIASVYQVLRKNAGGILIFFICGLPIYTTSLSVVNMYGLRGMVPVLQAFKEVIVLLTLGGLLYRYKGRFKPQLADKLVLFFLAYTFLYALIPLGQFGFFQKLVAFKGLSFFALVYFAGRLTDPRKIFIAKYFRFITAVIIVAVLVLLFEVITYQHLQTYTGYAAYNYDFFGQDPSGNYGLSWTFEVVDIGNSVKRFASFFANPLEFAAATVLSTSMLAALYTRRNNQLAVDNFGLVALACTMFAIFFALSRASLISYFLLVYVYAFLTRKRNIIRLIHAFFILAALYIIFLINRDVRDFIVDTLNFSNLSSLGHLLEWIDGIQAMISSPLGIGLGESGRIAAATGDNVGGESQLIIVGVQTGIVAVVVYISIYVQLMQQAFRWFRKLTGPDRKLALAVLLMKTGFIVPMITSNFESYIYLSYTGWFFSGLMIGVIARTEDQDAAAKQQLLLTTPAIT